MEYLNHAVIYQEDAIEKIVCEEINKLPRNEELIYEEMEILVNLNLILLDPKPNPLKSFETFQEKDKFFIYSVIEKRVEHCFTFRFASPLEIIFITNFTKTPGTAMLYLWYLQYWAFKNLTKENNVIDLEMLSSKIFPMGKFNQKKLSEIWDKQKVNRVPGTMGSDNLIDYSSAGISIQFK